MTAVVVSNTSLEAACAIAGGQFTVPLSADGREPATHLGCNWVGCPTEVEGALSSIPGVTMAETWAEALAATALTPMLGDSPP